MDARIVEKIEINLLEPKPILGVAGSVIPKPEDNQDTDRIVPADLLKVNDFSEIGRDGAFYYERKAQGINHPFDNPNFAGGTILLVGKNFGCGSSREHAPQALKSYGIQAILGESFVGIFNKNCFNIGILTCRISKGSIQEILSALDAVTKLMVEINLQDKKVYFAGSEIPLEIEEMKRRAYLDGTASLNKRFILLKNRDKILAVRDKLHEAQNF